VTIDLDVKLAVYRHFAEHTTRPTPAEVAATVQAPVADVLGAYVRLGRERVLVVEDDGEAIRMAPPFSGVPTQHVAIVHDKSYFANCAWDVLGIPAALQAAGTVHSRCEQSGEPLTLAVEADGPEASDWLFHCHVPAARWWDDIVFT
jgi:hypothetical protein